jgi:hypothetical protein
MSCIALGALALALSGVPASAGHCPTRPDLVAGKLGGAMMRSPGAEGRHELCRSYAGLFYDAVTARQAASACEPGRERQQALESLDSAIKTVNERIAAQCAADAETTGSGAAAQEQLSATGSAPQAIRARRGEAH